MTRKVENECENPGQCTQRVRVSELEAATNVGWLELSLTAAEEVF